MNENHIIEILDNASIERLSEFELNRVRIHARDCASCRGAYDAARLSALVLKIRAQTTIEPSPFFHTRVMAAVREQNAVENVPAMFRLWGSAKALVSSMAVTTAALAVLSFVLPAPAIAVDDQAVSVYSAESVIMNDGDEQPTFEQVLSTIYADDDEAK